MHPPTNFVGWANNAWASLKLRVFRLPLHTGANSISRLPTNMPQSDALQFNPLLATRPRRSIPRPSHQHFQAAAQIARNRKGSLKNECTRFSGCLYITPPNKHRQPANQSQYSAPFKHAFWQWAMSRRRSMPCQPQHRFQAAYFFLSLAFAGGLLLGFAADLSPAWGLAFSGCLLLGLAFSGCLYPPSHKKTPLCLYT